MELLKLKDLLKIIYICPWTYMRFIGLIIPLAIPRVEKFYNIIERVQNIPVFYTITIVMVVSILSIVFNLIIDYFFLKGVQNRAGNYKQISKLTKVNYQYITPILVGTIIIAGAKSSLQPQLPYIVYVFITFIYLNMRYTIATAIAIDEKEKIYIVATNLSRTTSDKFYVYLRDDIYFQKNT